MGIGTLLSLQRAAPVLLRHLSAYAELAEQDLAVSRADVAARVRAGVSLVISAIFALMMICACVIAATWDTPYRLTAVITMASLFMAAAIVSAIVLTKVPKQRAFAGVRGEWQRDRLLLEQVMLQGEAGSDPGH
jgi:uncharacterized membrane protein YqjE